MQKLIQIFIAYNGFGLYECTGVRNLHFIDEIMNQDIYLNILKTYCAAKAEKMFIKDDFVFIQNNDPKHAIRKIKSWLSANVTKYLVISPVSEHIPIENLLLNHLNRKI